MAVGDESPSWQSVMSHHHGSQWRAERGEGGRFGSSLGWGGFGVGDGGAVTPITPMMYVHDGRCCC